MENQGSLPLPAGIKYLKVINLITLYIFVACCGLGLWNHIQDIQITGDRSLLGETVLPLVFLIPVPLLFKLNQGLSSLKKNVRLPQIAWAAICLAAFPVGTVLYGIGLYFLLLEPRSKDTLKN